MSTLVETSPVRDLRDFITQRLTAAAVEIFTAFERTVAQYEQEIDRQRRLLLDSEKTAIKFHRIENPDLHFSDDNELWDQERICSPDQEGPVQIKDEEEDEEDAEPGRTETTRTDCDGGKNPRIKEEPEAPEITFSLDELSSVQDDEQLAENLLEGFSDDRRKSGPGGLDRRRPVNSGPGGRRGADAGKSAASDENRLKLQDTFPSRLKDERRVCGAERPFVCTICGKSFRRQRCLCVHTMTHTGEKPYACEVCGNRFRQPGHLRAHKRIHTGEKPYSCKTCGQIFRQYGHLFTHRKRHSRAKSQA